MSMGDTNSIAKLLEQLSSSTAWQQAVANRHLDNPAVEQDLAATRNQSFRVETPSKSREVDISAEVMEVETSAVAPSDKVGALLDLLGTTNSTKGTESLGSSNVNETLPSRPHNASPHEHSPSGKDLRHVSFSEAVQTVTKLAQSPTFHKHLKEIREEQNRLEQRYWESRQQLLQKQYRMIEELMTQVTITGTLGSREVERLKASFHKELSSLEQDEFLPAWDRLLCRQQATLQRMNVPLMFETSDVEARRKQQQILAVMEGLMEGAT